MSIRVSFALRSRLPSSICNGTLSNRTKRHWAVYNPARTSRFSRAGHTNFPLQQGVGMTSRNSLLRCFSGVLIVLCAGIWSTLAQAQGKPNVVFIMGDDVGWFNIGAY